MATTASFSPMHYIHTNTLAPNNQSDSDRITKGTTTKIEQNRLISSINLIQSDKGAIVEVRQ